MDPRAEALVSALSLAPHPEGGYYRELWRSPLQVLPQDARDGRSALTTIYFLLPEGAVSRWHRVRSDEVWQYAEGALLDLWITPPSFERLDRVQLGPLTGGATPTHVVPAGWWQAAHTTGAYSLVNCIVGPGFEFVDFEFLADDAGRVDVFRRMARDAARFL